MKWKGFALAALLVAGGGHAYADGFSDNEISVRVEPYATDPGVTNDKQPGGIRFAKTISTYTHVDGNQYGSNFFNIDVLKSASADPALNGGGGATEFYAIYRGNLSPTALFGGQPISIGPIVRDITFEYGMDFEAENNAFAPSDRKLVVGPNIHFNVPAGFLNLGLHLLKEWNHDAFAGAYLSYTPTFEMELTYQYPLAFTHLPLRFEGFLNVIAPKGNGYPGLAPTVTELLTSPRLTMDVGKLAFNKPYFLDAFVGYQYWMNKFGNADTKGAVGYVPASEESSIYFGAGVHF